MKHKIYPAIVFVMVLFLGACRPPVGDIQDPGSAPVSSFLEQEEGDAPSADEEQNQRSHCTLRLPLPLLPIEIQIF